MRGQGIHGVMRNEGELNVICRVTSRTHILSHQSHSLTTALRRACDIKLNIYQGLYRGASIMEQGHSCSVNSCLGLDEARSTVV